MSNRSLGLMILYMISLYDVVCERTYRVWEVYPVFDDIAVGRFDYIMCVQWLGFRLFYWARW